MDSHSSERSAVSSVKSLQQDIMPVQQHEQQRRSSSTVVQISTLQKIMVLLPAMLCSFLVFLDGACIVTATTTIVSEFGSITDIGWYSSVYLLATCCVQPLCGRIYGCLPLRNTYLGFLFLFEVGSILCSRANSAPMLIAGRAVAGLAGAGVLSGNTITMSTVLTRQEAAKWVSIVLMIGQLGFAFGPTIGGALTQYASWRWNFYINLPAGAIAAVLLLLAPVPRYAIIHKKTDKSKLRTLLGLDWLGFALFAGSIVMILVALQWGSGGQRPWKSAGPIGLFLGGGVGIAVFILWQWYKKDAALVPLSIMAKPVVFSSCFTCFMQMCNFSMSVWYIPLWFQIVRGATPMTSGIDLLPIAAGQLFCMALAGRLAGRYARYSVFCLVSGALIAVGAGLTTTFSMHTVTGFWVGAELIIGMGRGMGVQMPFLAVGQMHPREAAVANSMTIFSQYFGGAIFSGIAECILASSVKSAIEKTAPGVDVGAVLASGGKNLAELVPAQSLLAVLDAFNTALNHVSWLMVVSGVLMMFTCLGMGWKKPAYNIPAVAATQDLEAQRVDSFHKNDKDMVMVTEIPEVDPLDCTPTSTPCSEEKLDFA